MIKQPIEKQKKALFVKFRHATCFNIKADWQGNGPSAFWRDLYEEDPDSG